MAAPTNYYVDYATGNDYNHATFTDGAFTHATLNLLKTGAFTHSLAGHWLYLTDNGSTKITPGYYKIATWTDANNVILATDPSVGNVDATDVKCVQADGTALLPFRSVQGALDLIVRDAVNGDQINVVAGTAQVLLASIYLTTYGAPAISAPLILSGCTAIANDGGMGTIDCGGFVMFASVWNYFQLKYLICHTFGDNNGITLTSRDVIEHCEVHKGASAPSGKALISNANYVINCYIHDAGTAGIGISAGTLCKYNYIYNCPTGMSSCGGDNNIVVDCSVGIITGISGHIINNSIYSSTANTGSGISIGNAANIVLNNIVEGYSGVGGKGISSATDVAMIGGNAIFNCTTPKSILDAWIDLGTDVTLLASPFVNAAGGNFALKTTAGVGVIETAFPGAWYGPASTTNKADRGAVQNGAGAAAGISMPRVRVGH